MRLEFLDQRMREEGLGVAGRLGRIGEVERALRAGVALIRWPRESPRCRCTTRGPRWSMPTPGISPVIRSILVYLLLTRLFHWFSISLQRLDLIWIWLSYITIRFTESETKHTMKLNRLVQCWLHNLFGMHCAKSVNFIVSKMAAVRFPRLQPRRPRVSICCRWSPRVALYIC